MKTKWFLLIIYIIKDQYNALFGFLVKSEFYIKKCNYCTF
jgi:hypothetical protein